MAARGRLIRPGLVGLLAGLASLLTLYLAAAWIGSTLPRNSAWVEPDSGITIMVETNGVHTGIVMPVTTPIMDWRTVFPSATRPARAGELPTHIAVSWGEREVMLNVPTWSDLNPLTALRIVLTGGHAVMRVGHYVRPAPSAWHRPVRLRPEEYRRLVADILATLPPDNGGTRRTYPSFERGAANYDSLGRYTVLNTCNSWVGDRLAAAGVRVGRWTPLQGGVMKWVAPPPAG